MPFSTMLLMTALLISSPAFAEEWEPLAGMTTAKLAASGWRIDTSSGLSWPDGRQAVVSFWSMTFDQGQNFTMRCITYFDGNMTPTGDMCSETSS